MEQSERIPSFTVSSRFREIAGICAAQSSADCSALQWNSSLPSACECSGPGMVAAAAVAVAAVVF